MSKSTLTIACSTSFSGTALALVKEGTAAHRLVLSESGKALEDADIAFGQPDPDAVMVSPRLRWVHITSAGYTRYDREDFRAALRERNAVFTNSSHVYDEPCAQHAVAMMLALARQLPQCLESQRTDRNWDSGRQRANSFLLNGQTVLLLGFGAIGRRMAALLAPFQVRLVAVRRAAQGDEGIEIIGEADLERTLADADHVVNILPDNPSTVGYVNAARLAHMKPGVRFYNIGRGTTVDQEAVLRALESGQLGAAYLDVTDPEPLPPEHPLWRAPNCFITPHSAGGHAGESERLVRHFLANLAAFEKNEPLSDRVI